MVLGTEGVHGYVTGVRFPLRVFFSESLSEKSRNIYKVGGHKQERRGLRTGLPRSYQSLDSSLTPSTRRMELSTS